MCLLFSLVSVPAMLCVFSVNKSLAKYPRLMLPHGGRKWKLMDPNCQVKQGSIYPKRTVIIPFEEDQKMHKFILDLSIKPCWHRKSQTFGFNLKGIGLFKLFAG